jgi:hypothetical protein
VGLTLANYLLAMRELVIKCGRFVFKAELFETQTTRLLIKELPLTGNTNIWGEEIFFPVSITAELEENCVEEVDEGHLAYWPPGKAFCIFFGPTPVSTSTRPRAYSPVNVFGKIKGELDKLKEVTQGEIIAVDIMER